MADLRFRRTAAPATTGRCRRLALLVGFLAATALAAAPAAHGSDRIYWANFDINTISFANLDGTGGDDLDTGAATMDGPMGMALDPAAGRIYWANWGLSGNVGEGTTISYANLDGSGGGDLATGSATVAGPHGLAIDPAAGRIYWPNYGPRDLGNGTTISYANLDGTGGGDLNTGAATVSGPRGVAIDPAAGRIYWANYGPTGRGATISYANLDGSGGGDLMTMGATVEGPEGVALDLDAGRIFWGNYGPGNGDTIAYANLDGSGDAHDLSTAPVVPNRPHGVALDKARGKIYWANYGGGGSISSANLDGSGGGVNLPTAGASMSGPALPALLEVPKDTGAPTISGARKFGSTLSCTQGSWAPDILPALLYRAPQSFSYQWTLDGQEVPGATSRSATASTSGDYRCRVAARNAAGSTTQTSDPLTVAPPKTRITKKPKSKIKTTRRKVKVKVTFTPEAFATFKCKLDKANFKSCSSPFEVKVEAIGGMGRKHSISIKAIDGAGNVGKAATTKFRAIRKG